MRNWLLITIGLVLAVAGTIWALQGFGEIGGSFMSGDSVWAVIGPAVALIGLVIAVLGVLRARARGTRLPTARLGAAGNAGPATRLGRAARR